jgi:hypothetical protein
MKPRPEIEVPTIPPPITTTRPPWSVPGPMPDSSSSVTPGPQAWRRSDEEDHAMPVPVPVTTALPGAH